MPSIWQIKAVWNGFTGSPGYSTFRFTSDGTAASLNSMGAAAHAWAVQLAPYMLTSWNITFPTEVLELDVTTGTLLSANAMTTAQAAVAGTTAPTAYAGGSGAVITYHTPLIYRGRRVIGRTFCVPLVGIYENDGTLTSTAITGLTAAGNALRTATPAVFVIWAKQFDKSTKPPTQIGGASGLVSSVTVKDAASQLRSRRN